MYIFCCSSPFLWVIFRWAAASGDISLNSLILPAALYFWQIPHFMALAYMCRDDYAAGGYAHISLFI
jgi:protoheme IX farnesyltransferase